jgi:hypothetical protein
MENNLLSLGRLTTLKLPLVSPVQQVSPLSRGQMNWTKFQEKMKVKFSFNNLLKAVSQKAIQSNSDNSIWG